MGHLSCGRNSCICASGALDKRSSWANFKDASLEPILNGIATGLTLPAIKGAAIVSDSNQEALMRFASSCTFSRHHLKSLGLKQFEHLDWHQHFQEFYRIFLPLFLLFSAIALGLWLAFAPDKESVEKLSWIEKSGKAPIGLLNPTLEEPIFDPAFALPSPIEMVKAPVAIKFDPPMGTEHAGLTYNAQPFLTSKHLGDDINGIGGYNSDLGDPVYAVADGLVMYTGWPADGWGNVVIAITSLPNGRMIQTFYGHLDSIDTYVGARIRRGDQIGTVGNANGKYWAHLHFEIRTSPTLDCGPGYADSALDRLNGELFLLKYRGRDDDLLVAPPRGAPVDIETYFDFKIELPE